MSFARMESQIQQLDNRVTRLENQQDNMVEVLNRLDKRIALLLCKTDPTACLER
jgi:chaperonin cofactor prefoldin